jgi:Fe-S cluster assembly protein SufD
MMVQNNQKDAAGFRRSGSGRKVLSAEQKARLAAAQATAGEAQRIEQARQKDREEREKTAQNQSAQSPTKMSSAVSDDAATADQVKVPHFDPKHPYEFPALMPSSADRAIRSFNPSDFKHPTHQMDEWRYAPINDLQDFFTPFTASGTTEVSAQFEDGTPVPVSSDRSEKSQHSWVSFGQISADELSTSPAGTVGKPIDLPSALEWQASRHSSRFWLLEAHGDVTQPIVIRIHGTSLKMDSVHIVIVTHSASSLKVILLHTGTASLDEGVEIDAGESSNLNVSSIQEWDDQSRHLGNQRIHVGRNAQVQHNVVSLSGKIIRLRMDPDFGGPQGFLNMLGIYFADPSAYMEHRTMVVHNHPDCKSRVIYKGALEGRGARSAWVGNALILPRAPKTDSYELNRNLVLSPGAIANSEPQLEIENGDIVGAGHASSVGRFDAEQLFYLESRGIPETEARKLVVRGFFDELISQIGIESVQKNLMTVIDRRLARGESAAMTKVLEDN